MNSGSRICRFIVPLAVAAAMLVARVGADDNTGMPTVLVPDQALSTVLIDAEGWNEPIEVRVVTLSDEPTLSIPSEDGDPSGLARIATTITHPETGERIDINIVEVARRSGLRERGDRSTDWVSNNELPFTRASEIAFAIDGMSVRRNDESVGASDDQVVGWFSGTPIVELYVWRSATQARANYGLQIVTPIDGSRKVRGPLSSGGDPGGSTGPPPGGPGAAGGNVCGGDPGGSPGLPPCDPDRRGRR